MSGSTISLINLINGVKSTGNEVSIVYPLEKDLSVIKDFEKIGCKCYCLKRIPCTWYFSGGIKNKIKFPLYITKLLIKKTIFYYQLKKIIKKETPDIIHTNIGVVHEGFAIARKLTILHVWHLREYQLKDFKGHPFPSMRSFKKKLQKSYTVCITKDIQKYFGLENYSKSFVIYNPIMNAKPAIKENNKLSEHPYFLVANRISPEKGIEDIITAFSDFCRKNISYELKICGFGDEKYINFLKEKYVEKQIEKKIEFLGYMGVERIYDFIYNSRGVIVASYNEGFGRMTAEANMLGVPVIGRNTAGTKEILDQTNGGFKFETLDELTQNMEKLAKMPESEIHMFMKEPQKRARNLFSTEQHVMQIIDLYTNIIRFNRQNI